MEITQELKNQIAIKNLKKRVLICEQVLLDNAYYLDRLLSRDEQMNLNLEKKLEKFLDLAIKILQAQADKNKSEKFNADMQWQEFKKNTDKP